MLRKIKSELNFLTQTKFYSKQKNEIEESLKKNIEILHLGIDDKKRENFILKKENFNFKYKGTKENIYFYHKNKNKIKTFFSEKNIFQKKINVFFYNKNFYFIDNIITNFHFPTSSKLFSFSKNEITFLLDNFFKKKIISYISPKFISSYNFVDLDKNERFFVFLNNYFKNNKYKLIFPFDLLFFFNQHYFLFIETLNFIKLNEKKNNFIGYNIRNNDNLKIENNKFLFLKKTKENIYKKYKRINDFFIKNLLLCITETGAKKKQKILFFEEKKFLLKNNLFFDFLILSWKSEKIKKEYYPFSQKLLEKNFKITKYYFFNKQNLGLLRCAQKDKDNLYFFRAWESFSFSSWLFITQFIVSFFLLKITKDVYQDYGKELIQFLIEFGNSAEFDLEHLKEQYFIENSDYKIIRQTKKKFKDIIGIDFILPESGEILWLLKNNGRSAKYKRTIPKGILLTGPPGTGKTLLVQAIAGEAKVPVIVQSASLLINPKEKGRSSKKLKKIFQKARTFSPCIIFIDEIDSLGGKRQKFFNIGNTSDKIIESLYEAKKFEKTYSNPSSTSSINTQKKKFENNLFLDFSKNSNEQETKLNLLTQFLIEMDGLKDRKNIYVFGATNRLEILDPALIRPGRFDKIITFPAPSKKKRIQILKYYSKKRKIEKKISWNYLANRMLNFSAAEIAAIMNESTIQSIIKNTTHSVETIEKGINYITSYSISNIKNNLLRNKSYYQSGKALSYLLFSKKEKGVFLSIWDRKKNTRYIKNFDYFLAPEIEQTRKNFEFFLISSHFGKVGEFLYFFGKKKEKSKNFESDYGHEDRFIISLLTKFLIENWFFYSTKIFLRKENKTLSNFSILEKTEYNIVLSQIFENEVELEKKNEVIKIGKYQQRNFSAWWEQEISKRISKNETFYSDWYRLFLPDPEESLLNLEWIPPDLQIHNNEILKKLGTKSNINLNNLYKIERDFIFQSLILNTFDFAFSRGENLRQFLDFYADQLLRYGIIRDIEIKKIYPIKNN